MPNLTSNGHLHRGLGGYFLVTGPTETTSPRVSVHKAACDTFVALLADQNAANGLIVDYAENVYIPEPEPVEVNGKLHPSERNGLGNGDVAEFNPGESPTKLWNMWALQEQLGAAD